jgi:glycosyltransferase involved in cell wall biosynthesis
MGRSDIDTQACERPVDRQPEGLEASRFNRDSTPGTMRLLILTRYERLGASSRLRMLQYIPELERNGVRCTVTPLLSDHYLERLYASGTRSLASLAAAYLRRLVRLAHLARYDRVWIEKELFPSAPATVERLLARLRIPYVVDYDDAVFHNYDLSNSWLVRTFLGRKIDAVMARAGTVIAGNAYIADRARAAGAANVRIVPTVVDHRRYLAAPSTRGPRLTIGWVGSPATQHFLFDVAEALVEVCRRHGARLLLVGAQPKVANRFQEIDVEIRAWNEKTEHLDIAAMDIGIMPLRDKPWERGKCGYKLIQYMASGAAVCASPVGANIDIVCSSRSGLLASTADEWRLALDRLLTDDRLRRAMQENGRDAVKSRYSVESQASAILEAIVGSTASAEIFSDHSRASPVRTPPRP